jgi:uncharacterized membrane protein
MMDMMSIWMLILLLVLLVGVAAAVYVGVRAAKGPSRRDDHSPRDALQQRLAAGEISLEEFYERDSALREAGEPRRGRRRA